MQIPRREVAATMVARYGYRCARTWPAKNMNTFPNSSTCLKAGGHDMYDLGGHRIAGCSI
jgi:hypothetical protein